MDIRPIATGLTVAALALPATAFAQSAGDNQYVDPLAGQHAQTNRHASARPTPSSAPAPASAPAAAPTTPAPTSSTVTPSAPAAQTAIPLARTGFNAWIPALAGVLLIGAAVLLRRSARSDHP